MFSFNIYSYNTDIAKVFGVCSSIFLTFLSNENKKSIILNNSDDLVISRTEIYEITALEASKQEEIEASLIECGVISVKAFKGNPNKHHYVFNVNRLETIMSSTNPLITLNNLEPVEYSPKTVKKVHTPTKREKDIKSLKAMINEDNSLIQQYLCDWVDSVYQNPKGYIT